MRFQIWTSLAFLGLTSIGCSNSLPEAVAPNPQSSAVEQSRAKVSAPEVAVVVKSWEEIQTWVASQRGKIVVLDVWSNWWLECLREFPHFVQLHDELQADVACASVNVDYYGGDVAELEEIKPRVLKLLNSKHASMQNFISSDADEDVFKQINTASIPAAVVYDREGKVHTIFNNDEEAYGPGGFNYEEHITPLVKRLVAEAG